MLDVAMPFGMEMVGEDFLPMGLDEFVSVRDESWPHGFVARYSVMLNLLGKAYR